MSRAKYYSTPVFSDPVSGIVTRMNNIVVTVYQDGTTTPIGETIYAADSGGTTLPNPFNVSNGVVEFYLDTEKRVSIKFDASGSGPYGSITKNAEGVWPDPGLLRTSIKSADGTAVLQYDGSNRLSGPGMLKKWGAWHLELDGGLIPNDASESTNNTTKVGNLITEIKNVGGGDINISDTYYFDTFHLLHNAGYNVPINIYGSSRNSIIYFVGNAGPFMSIGTTAMHQMYDCVMQDITIVHQDAVDSGPDIYLGKYAVNYHFERVKIKNNGRPDDPGGVLPCRGSFINIQAQGTWSSRGCKFETRTDEENLVTGGPGNIQVINIPPDIGGFTLTDTNMDGCFNKSYGIRFIGSGLYDTPTLNNCIIKDHEYGLAVNGGSSGNHVINLSSNGLYLDGITGTGIFLEPVNGSIVSNWLFTNLWINALDHWIYMSGANSGAINQFFVSNGYWTNALLDGVYIQGGAGFRSIKLSHIFMNSNINVASNYAVNAGPANGLVSDLAIDHCTAIVGGSSGGAAYLSSNLAGAQVNHNLWVGKVPVVNLVDDGSSKSYQDNRYVASV